MPKYISITKVTDHPSNANRFHVRFNDETMHTQVLSEENLLEFIEAACLVHGGYRVVRVTEKKR